MTISAAQIRAGRGLLNWTAKTLAEKIGITPSSLSAIENGITRGSIQTLDSIQQILVDAGVEFLTSDGVALKRTQIIEYKGADGLRAFMDDVYQTARDVGGEICVHNALPSNWIKWLGMDWMEFHSLRMTAIKDRYKISITCPIGEEMPKATSYAEYRYIPLTMFTDRSFYCYGCKLAFLDFEKDDVVVYVLMKPEFAEGFRHIFRITWNHVSKIIEI